MEFPRKQAWDCPWVPPPADGWEADETRRLWLLAIDAALDVANEAEATVWALHEGPRHPEASGNSLPRTRPWDAALRLQEHLTALRVHLTAIDHRLAQKRLADEPF